MPIYTFIKGQKKYLVTNKLYYFLTPDYFGLSTLSTSDTILYADNSIVKIYHYDTTNKSHSIIACNNWLTPNHNYDIFNLNLPYQSKAQLGINYGASNDNYLTYYFGQIKYDNSISKNIVNISEVRISKTDNVINKNFNLNCSMGSTSTPYLSANLGGFRNDGIDYVAFTNGAGTKGFIELANVTNNSLIQETQISGSAGAQSQYSIFSTSPYNVLKNSSKGNLEGNIYMSDSVSNKIVYSRYFTSSGINSSWSKSFNINSTSPSGGYYRSSAYDGYYSFFKNNTDLILGGESITDNRKILSTPSFGQASLYHLNNQTYLLDTYNSNSILHIRKINPSDGSIINTLNTGISITNSLYTPMYVINSHRPSMTYKTSKWGGVVNENGVCMIDVTKL